MKTKHATFCYVEGGMRHSTSGHQTVNTIVCSLIDICLCWVIQEAPNKFPSVSATCGGCLWDKYNIILVNYK